MLGPSMPAHDQWGQQWASQPEPSSRTDLAYHWRFCLGFPCGSAGEESSCNAGNLGSIPRLGRSGEGKGYPLQYSGLENSTDCIIHGVTKSQIHLSNFHFQGFCLDSAETLQSPHTSIQLTSVESDPQPPENSGQLPTGQPMAGPQFNSTRHQSGPIHQDSLITLSTGGLSGLRLSLRAPQFGLWTETVPTSLHLGVFPKQRQHSPFHVCVSFWHQPS